MGNVNLSGMQLYVVTELWQDEAGGVIDVETHVCQTQKTAKELQRDLILQMLHDTEDKFVSPEKESYELDKITLVANYGNDFYEVKIEQTNII